MYLYFHRTVNQDKNIDLDWVEYSEENNLQELLEKKETIFGVKAYPNKRAWVDANTIYLLLESQNIEGLDIDSIKKKSITMQLF